MVDFISILGGPEYALLWLSALVVPIVLLFTLRIGLPLPAFVALLCLLAFLAAWQVAYWSAPASTYATSPIP